MIGHLNHVIPAFWTWIQINFCDTFVDLSILKCKRWTIIFRLGVRRLDLKLTSVDRPWPVGIEHIERLPQVRLHLLRQLQTRAILLLRLLFRLQNVVSYFYNRFKKCKQYRIPNSKTNYLILILIVSSLIWPQWFFFTIYKDRRNIF